MVRRAMEDGTCTKGKVFLRRIKCQNIWLKVECSASGADSYFSGMVGSFDTIGSFPNMQWSRVRRCYWNAEIVSRLREHTVEVEAAVVACAPDRSARSLGDFEAVSRRSISRWTGKTSRKR